MKVRITGRYVEVAYVPAVLGRRKRGYWTATIDVDVRTLETALAKTKKGNGK